jgi:hypothetical protein
VGKLWHNKKQAAITATHIFSTARSWGRIVLNHQGAGIITDKSNIENMDGKLYTNVDNFPLTSMFADKSTNPLIDGANFVNQISGSFQAGHKFADAVAINAKNEKNSKQLFYQVVTEHIYGMTSKYGGSINFKNSNDSVRKADSINRKEGHKVINESEF